MKVIADSGITTVCISQCEGRVCHPHGGHPPEPHTSTLSLLEPPVSEVGLVLPTKGWQFPEA